MALGRPLTLLQVRTRRRDFRPCERSVARISFAWFDHEQPVIVASGAGRVARTPEGAALDRHIKDVAAARQASIAAFDVDVTDAQRPAGRPGAVR